MIDEGYIKYQCTWHKISTISDQDICELNQYRHQLYQLKLIGEYENGIGFGNLSQRVPGTSDLIISGTQTGGLDNLQAQHYTRVIDYDWEKNYVTCQGLIEASSETLTHAAIYTALPAVNGVLHVHHRKLWQKLLHTVPTTHLDCAYGTPEMAGEIIRLCQRPSTKAQQIIVMSGHEEGILAFGKSLAEASEILLGHFKNL